MSYYREVNEFLDEFYKKENLNEIVQDVIEVTFDPQHGSPYWLSQLEKKIGFDPRKEIESYDDIKEHFPFYTQSELRYVRQRDFMPKLFYELIKNGNVIIRSMETGGTTGDPVSVPWSENSCEKILYTLEKFMKLNQFSEGEDILAAVPTGPHAIGWIASNLEKINNCLVYKIDLDPRFPKKMSVIGATECAKHYKKHIIDQIVFKIKIDKPKIIFSTPIILNELIRLDRQMNLELGLENIEGVMTGGTELTPETYRLWKDEIFPNASFLDIYGNVLFGITCSVPSKKYDLDHYPSYPITLVDIIDPQTQEFLDYGERGQVVFTRLTPECFIPKKIERDLATKIYGSEHEDALRKVYEGKNVKISEIVGVRNVENIKEVTKDGKPVLGVY